MSKWVRIAWILLKIGVTILAEWLWMIIRLPVRLFNCSFIGHEWLWLGNGFFGMLGPSKAFKCIKCGFKTAHPENHKTILEQRGQNDE